MNLHSTVKNSFLFFYLETIKMHHNIPTNTQTKLV